MTDLPTDRVLDRVIAACRTPATPAAGFDRRVLQAVRTRPGGGRVALWASVGLGAAAALVALAVNALGPARRGAPTVAVHFELDLPAARSVALLGDFNDWDRANTAVLHAAAGGRWTVTLDLPHGVYRYAFLVNGTDWMADPTRPEIRDPDFGTPTSVLSIRGPSL